MGNQCVGMSKLLGKHMLGNGKCSVRRMTFKQLDKCCRNKTVQVPEAIQTELEHDKVKAIIKAYKKRSLFYQSPDGEERLVIDDPEEPLEDEKDLEDGVYLQDDKDRANEGN